MDPPGADDPSARLIAALDDGLRCLHALVLGIDAGAADLGIDRSTWASALTALEWAMTELRTNELVTSGFRLTDDDVARVRRIDEQVRRALEGGEASTELYGLAVRTLETMCGPDWREKLGRPGQRA